MQKYVNFLSNIAVDFPTEVFLTFKEKDVNCLTKHHCRFSDKFS